MLTLRFFNEEIKSQYLKDLKAVLEILIEVDLILSNNTEVKRVLMYTDNQILGLEIFARRPDIDYLAVLEEGLIKWIWNRNNIR